MNNYYFRVFLLALLSVVTTIFNPLQAAIQDTLQWSWEVTTTSSTAIKSVTTEYKGEMQVEWGDGSTELFSDSLSGKTLVHTYSHPGNYTCKSIVSAITYFKADSKRLLTLDPSGAHSLTYLSCTSNQLASLHLSNVAELVSLYCSGNDLQTLNVSNCAKLQTLTCSDNALKALDVSMLPALKKLTCHTNALTDLRISSVGSLSYVSCTGCGLQVEALHTLFSQLPVLTAASASKNLYILNNPGSAACNTQTALQKNWLPDKASNGCAFYFGTSEAKAGSQSELVLSLSNPVPVLAFEIDAELPAGFMPDSLKITLDASRKGRHLLTVAPSPTQANVYKFMAYSLTPGDVFRLAAGPVLHIAGKAPDSSAQYPIRILKAILVDSSTNAIPVVLQDGTLTTLPAFVSGDGNSDGRVDISDVVALVARINSQSPVGFNDSAVDLDLNGTLNVADIAKLVVLIGQSEYTQAAIIDTDPLRAAASGLSLSVGQKVSVLGLMPVCLLNNQQVQGLQFDIELPEDISVEDVSENAGLLNSGHQIRILELGDRMYRVLIYALQPGSFLQATNGVVAELPVKSRTGEGGVFPVKINHAVACNANFQSVFPQTTDGSIELDPEPVDQEIHTACIGGQLCIAGNGLIRVSAWNLNGEELFSEELKEVACFQKSMQCGLYLIKAVTSRGKQVVTKILIGS